MNQLIDLLDSALQANLTKRQWAAFAAVLRQTVGYRKHEDDISARRFEQLTGIRRNHIWQAKHELVAMGLIEGRRGKYGDIIGFKETVQHPHPNPSPTDVSGETVLSQGEGLKNKALVSPSPDGGRGGRGVRVSSPKTGQPDSQIGPESVPKQDTTLSNLTQGNQNSTVVPLRYPSVLSPTERQQAPQKLDGLSPQAAQQVLDVWALKIERGEVRKSRMGLLMALVNAQRNGRLNTDGLPQSQAATLPDPRQQQRLNEREHWLEQQAQQGWQRDMARLAGLPPDKFQVAGFTVAGGVS